MSKFTLDGGTLEDGSIVRAYVRYDDECKNGHRTFGITGEVWEQGSRVGNRFERGLISCGCVHDAVSEAYPELAPFIRWHLSGENGPMHYEANARHWAEKALGLYRTFEDYDFEVATGDWGPFERTVVYGAVRTDSETLALVQLPIDVKPDPGIVWEQYADSNEGKARKRRVLRGRVAQFCQNRRAELWIAFERDMDAVFAIEQENR